jgi:GAF domain-containing protein
MLAQMAQRLCAKRTFEDVIQTILDDAIALHGAEYGNVQLPMGDELAIAAQRGLSAAFLKTFRRVKKDDGCAGGRALRLGTSVIIADVEKDPEFAAFRIDAKLAGFRSVQSSPFFTKGGNLLGLISTHFAHVHEPTPIEMDTLKVYGVVAADYAYKLLGDVTLATKAEQMSEKLYSDISDHQDYGLPFVSAPPTFAIRRQ